MTDQPISNKGGARPGAGRPRKRDVHGTAIVRAEKQIRDRLPELVDNMFRLAMGGYERVEEQWAPAGSVLVGTGESAYRLYPDKPDDELVLVKRLVSIADKDRAANTYLIDRIMGKPTERKEISGPDSGPIEFNYGGTLTDLTQGSDDHP